MRFLNLRGDGLEAPVGSCHKMRPAHLALVEPSHGNFGTRVGSAF
jgi:hypothetical protein